VAKHIRGSEKYEAGGGGGKGRLPTKLFGLEENMKIIIKP